MCNWLVQVKTRDGDYIDVPYMPEAVLLNGGALMQQWTGDRIYAAVRICFYNNCV